MRVRTCTYIHTVCLQSVHTVQGKQPIVPGQGHIGLLEQRCHTQSESAKIVKKSLQRYWERHTSYISSPFCSQIMFFSHVCCLNCLLYQLFLFHKGLGGKVWEQMWRLINLDFTWCDHCTLGYLHVFHWPALETQPWSSESFSHPISHLLASSFLKYPRCCVLNISRAFLIPGLTIN